MLCCSMPFRIADCATVMTPPKADTTECRLPKHYTPCILCSASEGGITTLRAVSKTTTDSKANSWIPTAYIAYCNSNKLITSVSATFLLRFFTFAVILGEDLGSAASVLTVFLRFLPLTDEAVGDTSSSMLSAAATAGGTAALVSAKSLKQLLGSPTSGCGAGHLVWPSRSKLP